MSNPVDLYDSAYAGNAEEVYREVRRETYELDLGQTGWMTAAELESFGRLLLLRSGSRVLEIGCGAGGCAVHLARTAGIEITGIDINEKGIQQAKELARAGAFRRRSSCAGTRVSGCRLKRARSMQSSRTTRCAISRIADSSLRSGGAYCVRQAACCLPMR